MRKIGKSLFVAIAFSAIQAFVFSCNAKQENWVEIPKTGGILYDTDSLRRDGDMVYVSLKNENPGAKRASRAEEIKFTAAFYCKRGKVRTLSQTIVYSGGLKKTTAENHLENEPGRDEINETHDLQDISSSPALENAYNAFCK